MRSSKIIVIIGIVLIAALASGCIDSNGTQTVTVTQTVPASEEYSSTTTSASWYIVEPLGFIAASAIYADPTSLVAFSARGSQISQYMRNESGVGVYLYANGSTAYSKPYGQGVGFKGVSEFNTSPIAIVQVGTHLYYAFAVDGDTFAFPLRSYTYNDRFGTEKVPLYYLHFNELRPAGYIVISFTMTPYTGSMYPVPTEFASLNEAESYDVSRKWLDYFYTTYYNITDGASQTLYSLDVAVETQGIAGAIYQYTTASWSLTSGWTATYSYWILWYTYQWATAEVIGHYHYEDDSTVEDVLVSFAIYMTNHPGYYVGTKIGNYFQIAGWNVHATETYYKTFTTWGTDSGEFVSITGWFTTFP